MIVQPAPTGPRSPVRRGLRLAGLALPPLLLAGVVVAGLAGPRPEPGPADVVEATSPPPTAQAAASDGPATPPAAAVAPERPPGVPATIPAFPAAAAGLPVRTVPEARRVLAAAGGVPLAVAGWFGSLQPPEACALGAGDTRGVLGPLCERRARLLVADPDAANPFAHLHVRIPPGVRLPPAFERPGAGGDAPAPVVPVVLVGRAETSGSPCAGSTRGCGESFVVDLVAWADGRPFEPGVVFDAGLEVPPPSLAYRNRDEAVALAAGQQRIVLVAAAVRPRTVAALDPGAGRALEGADVHGLVWYVRGLETQYGPARYPPGDYPPRVRWVVLDHETGALLASGTLAG